MLAHITVPAEKPSTRLTSAERRVAARSILELALKGTPPSELEILSGWVERLDELTSVGSVGGWRMS